MKDLRPDAAAKFREIYQMAEEDFAEPGMEIMSIRAFTSGNKLTIGVLLAGPGGGRMTKMTDYPLDPAKGPKV